MISIKLLEFCYLFLHACKLYTVAGFSVACAFIHIQVVKWLIDRVSHKNLHHASMALSNWQFGRSWSILLGQQSWAVLSFHWTLYFSTTKF